MVWFGKLVIKIVALTVVSLPLSSAMASTYLGELSAGYSDSVFHIGGNTSSLAINIDALGSRSSALCPSCTSGYTDNFSVNLYNQAGSLLESVSATNYLYSSMYSSSHGIGAGPVWLTVPTGATTLEIVSQLSITGLLGSDGNALGFGDLNISSNGSISATPIPPTLPLLATGLVALAFLAWRGKRNVVGSLVSLHTTKAVGLPRAREHGELYDGVA
jgi:hypothetical protein